MGLNYNAILNQINVVTGTHNDPSRLTSRTSDSKKSSNATTYKGHRKSLVTSHPLQKDTIHQRERTESHGSKSNYKGSDNSYTERSHH